MLGSNTSTRSTTVQQQRGRLTLEKLPWSVIRRLTQLLDQAHPEHHSWSSLLSHAEVVGKLGERIDEWYVVIVVILKAIVDIIVYPTET